MNQQNYIPVFTPYTVSLKDDTIRLRRQMSLVISESFSRIRRSDELLKTYENSYSKLNTVKFIPVTDHVSVQYEEPVVVTLTETSHIEPVCIAGEIAGSNENTTNSLPEDYKYEIDLSHRQEVRFWSRQLNVSLPELIKAIEATQSQCWRKIREYFISNREAKNKFEAATVAIGGAQLNVA